MERIELERKLQFLSNEIEKLKSKSYDRQPKLELWDLLPLNNSDKNRNPNCRNGLEELVEQENRNNENYKSNRKELAEKSNRKELAETHKPPDHQKREGTQTNHQSETHETEDHQSAPEDSEDQDMQDLLKRVQQVCNDEYQRVQQVCNDEYQSNDDYGLEKENQTICGLLLAVNEAITDPSATIPAQSSLKYGSTRDAYGSTRDVSHQSPLSPVNYPSRLYGRHNNNIPKLRYEPLAEEEDSLLEVI